MQTYKQRIDNLEKEGIIVSPTEPVVNRRKVWMQKGKNLISSFQTNMSYDSSTQKVIYNPNFGISNFIKISRNAHYIVSDSLNSVVGAVFVFDKNKNYLEVINSDTMNQPFTVTNPSAEYILIQLWNLNIVNETWVQLEQNLTVTEYEEYIEEKVFVLNENNVYEEFTKKQQEDIYSTTEQVIGKWINGKPIYRQVLIIQGYTTGSFIDLSNYFIETLLPSTSILADLYNDQFYTVLPVGGYQTPEDNSTWGYSTKTKQLTAFFGSLYNNFNKALLITLEYTKTID